MAKQVTDLTQVDDARQHILGALHDDGRGNLYIYLKGVGSTIAGSFVSFDEAHETLLIAANAVGRVAVAMGAIVANKFGWYQIFGKNTFAATDAVAADKALYIDATAGRADDSAVTGDLIVGAWSRTADNTNVTTVELNHPCVTDVLG